MANPNLETTFRPRFISILKMSFILFFYCNPLTRLVTMFTGKRTNEIIKKKVLNLMDGDLKHSTNKIRKP
jgi:hypothetical protein